MLCVPVCLCVYVGLLNYTKMYTHTIEREKQGKESLLVVVRDTMSFGTGCF